MKKYVVVLAGKVINVGHWPVDDLVNGEYVPDFPEGAIAGEFEVVITADGLYVLADNYRELRAAEYPAIGDQLDSLFKAGIFPPEMAEKIFAIKQKYPKSI